MDNRACGGWGQLHNENETTIDNFEIEIPNFLTSEYKVRESARNLCMMAYECERIPYRTHEKQINQAKRSQSLGYFLLLCFVIISLLLLGGFIETCPYI